MIYDNPAAALQSILEKGLGENREEQCLAVWHRLLNVTPEDQGGVIGKLAVFMELPRRTEVIVRTSFKNQTKYIDKWAKPIENAFFNQSLSGKWATFINHIPEHCIANLGLTAELIQVRLGANLMAEDDLNKIISLVSELIKDIDMSPLDVSLKSYLGRELSELQQIIRNYKISGAIPILQKTESLIGHSLLDPAYGSFLTDDTLGVRLMESLGVMANLLTVAVSLPQLSQGLVGLLTK